MTTTFKPMTHHSSKPARDTWRCMACNGVSSGPVPKGARRCDCEVDYSLPAYHDDPQALAELLEGRATHQNA